MKRYGLNYGFKNSIKDFGAYVRYDNRQMSSKRKIFEYNTPNSDGSIIYDTEKYENKKIQVSIIFTADSQQTFRKKARDITAWLTNHSMDILFFDDEPDLVYDAIVVDEIDLHQMNLTGICEVTFTTKPYAYQPQEEYINFTFTEDKGSTFIEYDGTAKTAPIITITNIGTENINKLTLYFEYPK